MQFVPFEMVSAVVKAAAGHRAGEKDGFPDWNYSDL